MRVSASYKIYDLKFIILMTEDLLNKNYKPFARKYRPSNFSELLGQEVLVKTLSYCVNHNRLASAYLLTGIRGVGKTSSARIIAKTVNCTNRLSSQHDVSSCNQCQNCLSFNNQSHPDIIEIDAASRTGVDDVREIIESSEYRPLLGAYKFFIIDEVHMLSKSAFNALLKIIEEPPAHVIFIFATTEAVKIPLTVISRCQRYDLRRLSQNEIEQLLVDIATKEQLKFDLDALQIIANKSEGSARDAVSMLDQAASYIHNINQVDIISAELVSQMLGLLNSETFVKVIQLIIANAPKDAIDLLNKIYSQTSSLENFIQELTNFIAELCKAKVIPNYHAAIYQNFSSEISDILIGTPLSRLSTLWQIFINGAKEIKTSHNQLITAQMLVIKAIYACNIPTIDEITDYEKPIEVKHSGTGDFYDFLKFCHQHKEIEIYYLLMNDVEVISFADYKMILACSDITNVKRIEELLSNWSGNSWNIEIEKRDQFTNTKTKLLEKVKLSEDYQTIKKYFPDSNISDIILKS